MQPKMIHKQFSSGFVHCHQWSNEIKACNKICDPPQEFDAKGESTRTTRLHDTLSVL